VHNSITSINTILTNIQSTQVTDEFDINSLRTMLGNLQTQLAGLTTTSTINNTTVVNNIAALQTTINTNTAQLAILNGYDHITQILDPCGPSHYDEVFLRLSTGQVLASFSDTASGLNTRFSVLQPSDITKYNTTDGSSCTFKLFATGPKANKVCWGNTFSTCI
jgi:hypothetical protein